MVKDRAGNSLSRASKWNAIDAKTLARQDFVGNSDKNDLYRFRLGSSGRVNITLSEIQKGANADLELFTIKGKANRVLKKIGKIAFEQLSKADVRRYFKRIAISQQSSRKADSISTALEAGEYYLRVHQRKGNTRYKLQVAATSAITVEDIFPNNPNEVRSPIFGSDLINGSLAETDQANPTRTSSLADDYYLTGVTPGQQLTVRLNSVEFDSYLQIVNVNSGELIAESNDVGGTLNPEITFKVNRGIDYIVRATSAASNGRGNYILSSTASSPIVGSLAVGGQISGSLTTDDLSNSARINSYSDDYLLTNIPVGKQLQISLNSTEFDAYLQLINTDTGEILGSNDFIGNPNNPTAVLKFAVQAGISYAVRATSFRLDEVGNYTLNVIQEDTNIQPDQTVWGILGKGDEGNVLLSETVKDDYTLSGITPGQQLQFNLESESFNARLQLLDANTQQVITEQDDIAPQTGDLNAKLVFTAQPNANYVLRITSSNARGAGLYQLTSHNLSTDWFSSKLTDPGIQNLARQRAADSVFDRSDVLSLFNEASNDDGALDGNELADLRQLEADGSRFDMPTPLRSAAGQVTSSNRAGTNATQFQASFGALFLSNSDGPPPPVFNEKDNDGKVKKTYQFDYVALNGSLFGDADADPAKGTNGRAQISHIDQGVFGDCTFLAALGSTFGQQRQETGQISQSVDSMIRTNSDGTFSVRFYSAPNQATWVTVNSRVVADKSGSKDDSLGRSFFGASADTHDSFGSPADKFQSGSWTNNPDKWPIWVPIVERAYAVFRQTVLKQGSNGWDLIGNGDQVQAPLLAVTGRSVTHYRNGLRVNGSKLQPETLSFTVLRNALANGQFITVGTPGDGSKKKSGKLAKGKLVTSHAYSVTDIYVSPSGEQRVVVRNPWGQDNQASVMKEKLADGKTNPEYKPDSWVGDKWDGFIDLSYSEFAASFESFAITDPVPGSFSLTDTIPLPPPINTAPTVSTNQGLFVLSGGTGAIANTRLRTTDNQQAANQITYTLTDTPKSGKLLLNGSSLTIGAKFTQAQIDGGQVGYRNEFGIKRITSSPSAGYDSLKISGLNAVWLDQGEIYFYNGTTSATTKLTTNGSNFNPQISGSNIVWERIAPGEDAEIFVYNGSSVTQLTNDTLQDRSPKISGAYVTWIRTSSRDPQSPFYYRTQIQLYDGSTGQIAQIASGTEYSNVDISGTNLTWERFNEIYFYNGSTTTLTGNNAEQDGLPQVSGSNIAWVGSDSDTNAIYRDAIYFYNGSQTTKLANVRGSIGDHEISGSNVVWSGANVNFTEPNSGDKEIYFYNGNSVAQLTSNSFEDVYPNISGSNIVWIRRDSNNDGDNNDNEIYFYNGSSAIQLANNLTYTSNDLLQISGSNVAWTSGEGIFFSNSATTDTFGFSVTDGAGGTTSGTFDIAIG
ncbi:MAG TPA: cadherin-like domain-containing protein [Coleofasciculaceae cyanobacterium]|jgi:hypothetical protein